MGTVTTEPNVVSWASILDEPTRLQAERLSRSPVVAGHVALMADAHLGIGATIGSVIPTVDALIPAAVGVDIGCGMIAVRTDLLAADLGLPGISSTDARLASLHARFASAIPAGVGEQHLQATSRALAWLKTVVPPHELGPRQQQTALVQLGTLGAGNHFLEVSLDEDGQVWVVVHSGSRGIGNQLATQHIRTAKTLAKANHVKLEDPDLAYFQAGTPEFEAYVLDMTWAQSYAWENREAMMDRALALLDGLVGRGSELERINCHHNFATPEVHGGRTVWITRKGAIRARNGDMGIIPGSMSTATYIVKGLGNPLSYNSSAHGAGRQLSRGAAKRAFTVESLQGWMVGKVWNSDKPEALLDEHPEAYKDIEQVMKDQADLVQRVAKLTQIVNYKGA